MDEKTIAELKAKHGEIFVLTASGEEVAAKAPPRAEYKRFRAEQSDERTKSDALESFACRCIVWPEPADVTKLFDRKPALADVFGGQLLEIAGMGEKATAKKL